MYPYKIANFLNYKFPTLGDFNSLKRYWHDEQMKSPPITTTRDRFDFPYVTLKDVLNVLRQLNGNMPLGPCQLPGLAL